MWVADRRFSGVIDGAEKIFRPGDPITEAEAKELALDAKPRLAKPQAKKDAKNGPEIKGA